MIELHTFPTPNSWKVSIALEELALPYEIHGVNIARGEQFEPAFLAISPNNRIPALVDREPPFGGEPVSIFESGAILLYLADKTRQLMPTDPRRRIAAQEWLMWQMANQGPMCGQAGHFLNYAPEPIDYAIERYTKEVKRLYTVLDQRLADHEYLADEYSMADIICWPWVAFREHHRTSLDELPNLRRWYEALEARPAVQRGRDAGTELAQAMRDGLDDEARKHLFGRKSE